MIYSTFQFIHVLGTVLLIGNVTVTAVWKVFADRTGNPSIVAYAQRLVIYTDWAFTLGGVTLILAGGYGMAWSGKVGLLSYNWLAWGQALFVLSGAIWLCVLVPTQIQQARIARKFAPGTEIPAEYRRLNRRWIVWGVLATIPLVIAMFLMIVKV